MDISGEIFRYLRKLFIETNRCFFTPVNVLSARAKGISLGNGCRFWGYTYFSRYVNSKITVGSNTTFRSDKRSNLAGLNRGCVVATHSQEAIVKIGRDCGLSGTVIGAAINIKIGDNVMIGANCFITDFDWHSLYPETRNKTFEKAPIAIGDNVWIAGNCTILKGVTIGNNAVIGANSLVLNDVPANVIAGGNPCKVLRSLY